MQAPLTWVQLTYLKLNRSEATADKEQVILAHGPVCLHEVRLEVNFKKIACTQLPCPTRDSWVSAHAVPKHNCQQLARQMPSANNQSGKHTGYAFDCIVKWQDVDSLPIRTVRAGAHMDNICITTENA